MTDLKRVRCHEPRLALGWAARYVQPMERRL